MKRKSEPLLLISVNAVTTSFKLSTLQMVKVSMKDLDSINVYRSSSHRISETAEALENMIDPMRATIITGDFNVCLRKNKTNAIYTGLERNGFSQLQTEASHIRGGIIDHIYWQDPMNQSNHPILERHVVYHSDHDAILVTVFAKWFQNMIIYNIWMTSNLRLNNIYYHIFVTLK